MSIPIAIGLAGFGVGWAMLYSRSRANQYDATNPQSQSGGEVKVSVDSVTESRDPATNATIPGTTQTGSSTSPVGTPSGGSGTTQTSDGVSTTTTPATGGVSTSSNQSTSPPPPVSSVAVEPVSRDPFDTGLTADSLRPQVGRMRVAQYKLSPQLLWKARYGNMRGVGRSQLSRDFADDGALHGAVW